jgi:hypothetical protein
MEKNLSTGVRHGSHHRAGIEFLVTHAQVI